MTFNEFRSTVVFCDDLKAKFGEEYFTDTPNRGYVFNDSYWLVQNADGSLYAQIGISERNFDHLFEAAIWLWDKFADGDING